MHSFTPIVSILDMDIHIRSIHMCAKFEQNRIRFWRFWKIDLDLKNVDLQRLERSWPTCVIVSRNRNILVPVGSLYDHWLKSYDHICENWVRIFCDLDLGPIFTKFVIYHATGWNKYRKREIIIQVSSMLWWYECWCYWQKMPYPV